MQLSSNNFKKKAFFWNRLPCIKFDILLQILDKQCKCLSLCFDDSYSTSFYFVYPPQANILGEFSVTEPI